MLETFGKISEPDLTTYGTKIESFYDIYKLESAALQLVDTTFKSGSTTSEVS